MSLRGLFARHSPPLIIENRIRTQNDIRGFLFLRMPSQTVFKDLPINFQLDDVMCSITVFFPTHLTIQILAILRTCCVGSR